MAYGGSNLQGYFGESFVRVLASAAGRIASKPDIDMMGVDFTLSYPGSRGTTRFPMIDVQVKSWSRAVGSVDVWHYPMKVAHFNNLAGGGYSVPRYLFLVVVPDDEAQYAEADVDALQLRHCGYYVSLASRPQVDAGQQKQVTVPVPRQNVLTVQALRGLMHAVPAQRAAMP
ncbi:DUF4365 domain-containing protein [Phytohabitans suffuscus]|uniref:DUF4365 domain-containing protein n=1 Tax=Phytohabitans suffuscus TaxID=624315 RepID=A0A6F8YKY3_9ACTN|nr:DUF4365 domain-containing protein [Phytohabitans suffuscus]BCB86601.1 hypothetical protein Psuf_039140 [Phytohabitans suffuscus]